jgi:hypothetical protein
LCVLLILQVLMFLLHWIGKKLVGNLIISSDVLHQS